MPSDTFQKKIWRPTKVQIELESKLKECSRASPADKSVLSRNLGILAEKINPTDPRTAMKQIIALSGLRGTVQDKPKRYFQFDGEKAPKEGFAAEGVKYKALAEAAGELGCTVKRSDYKERARYEAIQKLADGTSFAPVTPSNFPENDTLKAIIDEYFARVSQAIEERSDLQSLWASLRSTPISVDSHYIDQDVQPSPWGSAENVPTDIVTKKGLKFRFSPNDAPEYQHLEIWTEPSIELGHITISHKVRLFTIPKGERELFASEIYGDEVDSLHKLKRLNSLLESIGYSDNEASLSEIDNSKVGSWQNYNICFVYKVYMNAKEQSDGKINLGLRLEPIPHGNYNSSGTTLSFLSSNYFGLAKHHAQLRAEHYCLTQEVGPAGLESIFQPDRNGDYDFENYDSTIFIHTFFDCAQDSLAPEPVAFANSHWQLFDSNVWIDNIEFEEFQILQKLDVELSDPVAQKLLFGIDNIKFFPSIKQASSSAGAAMKDSIAASILYNLAHADDENLISNKLLKVSQITATSGLDFINSMIEKHRASLSRI